MRESAEDIAMRLNEKFNDETRGLDTRDYIEAAEILRDLLQDSLNAAREDLARARED